jgi:uncharacterized Tic20 family protein
MDNGRVGPRGGLVTRPRWSHDEGSPESGGLALNFNPSADERNWAVAAHLSALAGLVVTGLGIVLGPLVVWFLKKDQMPFVDDQAKEALNFQITVFIAGAICTALIFVLIGIPLLVGLAIFDLICIIMAAVKTANGETYRYPVNLRLIK